MSSIVFATWFGATSASAAATACKDLGKTEFGETKTVPPTLSPSIGNQAPLTEIKKRIQHYVDQNTSWKAEFRQHLEGRGTEYRLVRTDRAIALKFACRF